MAKRPAGEAFVALNPAQRAKVLKDEGGCSQCLSWGHSQRQCNRSEARQQPGKTLKCQEKVGSRICGEFHHPMLHGSNQISGSVNHALGSSHQPFDPRPDIFTGNPQGHISGQEQLAPSSKLLQPQY